MCRFLILFFQNRARKTRHTTRTPKIPRIFGEPLPQKTDDGYLVIVEVVIEEQRENSLSLSKQERQGAPHTEGDSVLVVR